MKSPSAGATPAGGLFAFRVCLLSGVVAPMVPQLIDEPPSAVVAAAGLLLIATSGLVAQMARGPAADPMGYAAPATAAAPGVLVLAITLLPPGIVLVFSPLVWLTAVWSGVPTGTGLLPSSANYPLEVAFAPQQAVAVAIAAVAAGVLGYTVWRRLATAAQAVGLILPVALPLGLASAGAAWPAVPLVLLAIGLGFVTAAAIATLRPSRRS